MLDEDLDRDFDPDPPERDPDPPERDPDPPERDRDPLDEPLFAFDFDELPDPDEPRLRLFEELLLFFEELRRGLALSDLEDPLELPRERERDRL